MTSGFELVVGAFFLLALCPLLFMMSKQTNQWIENTKQQPETRPAKVITKRLDVYSSVMVRYTTTNYYVTFELPNGERREIQVSGKEYGRLAEHDRGRLTMQGTRYLGFQRFVN